MAIEIEKLHRQFLDNDFDKVFFHDAAKERNLEMAKMLAAGIPPAAMPRVSGLGFFGKTAPQIKQDEPRIEFDKKNDFRNKSGQ